MASFKYLYGLANYHLHNFQAVREILFDSARLYKEKKGAASKERFWALWWLHRSRYVGLSQQENFND